MTRSAARARRNLAAALAAAFLDGDWHIEEMVARGRLAVTARRAWVRRVALRVSAAYETAPRAEPAGLASFIGELPSLVGAKRAVRIRRWFLPSPAMAASPWRVPPIATTGELATWLGLTAPMLDWMADTKGLAPKAADEPLRHYRCRWLAKRSGGVRLLEVPKPRLLAIQRRILREILDAIPPHDAAHGFRRERSVKSYASPHACRVVVLRMDLSDFFATVRAARVEKVFRAAGYPEGVAHTLATLCTTRTPSDVIAAAGALQDGPRDDLANPWQTAARLRTRHLPQGAPTSPALANLCAFRLDVRLAAAAASVGATYTRYADDVAFSGDEPFARRVRHFETLVTAIALEEGFAVNPRKSRLLGRGVRQQLAGIVVNHHPNVPRDEYDRLKATLHNCVRKNPATQNREGHPDFRAFLRGRVAWVTMVDPHRGARLRRLFDQVEWPGM